jgi:hypothetical protein
MKCPECGLDRLTILSCQACPLVCCYQCALKTAHLECERVSDWWPAKKTGEKRDVGMGTTGAGLTKVSPSGHRWEMAVP